MDQRYRNLYSTARKNAKKRGIDFNLSIGEMGTLISEAEGMCYITKIPFSLEKAPNETRRPWGPSLDRIDSQKGYSHGNCRLVCVAANYAMNEWGDKVLYAMAASMNGGRKNFGGVEQEDILTIIEGIVETTVKRLVAEQATIAMTQPGERKEPSSDAEKLLSVKQVVAEIGISRSQIYRLIADGFFPKAVQISPHRIGWFQSEIKRWLVIRQRTS